MNKSISTSFSNIEEIREYAVEMGFRTPADLIRKAVHQYMRQYPNKKRNQMNDNHVTMGQIEKIVLRLLNDKFGTEVVSRNNENTDD